MFKQVYDATSKTVTQVELTAEEIALRAAIEAEAQAKEALPKPGQDLLDAATAATKYEDLQPVVIELIRRVYGLA